MESNSIIFGPVPSRRLGYSLGINNVFPKTCSYNCIYCQLGKTIHVSAERRRFYDPLLVYQLAKERLGEINSLGLKVDYVTFVPDGEPTLDVNIGKEIRLLKGIGARVAVITNSSLLYLGDVREDLLEADLVSIKVDAVSEKLWRAINRPSGRINIEKTLEGIKEFSREYKGRLISETMLLSNYVSNEEIVAVALFLSKLKALKTAYIAVPVRPPAESWVKPPKETDLVEAYNIFKQFLGERVELLIGSPQGIFGYSGSFQRDLLSITSVHPMKEKDVMDLLERDNGSVEDLNKLLASGDVIKVEYNGEVFYVRRFTEKQGN
ncbi:MAG: radical SAM protein [Caldisphaeraceae archaeon]|nr:radical SAM protein [Caldisphaeraceae archaeon]